MTGASLARCDAENAFITFPAPSPFRVKPVNPSGGLGLEAGFSTLCCLHRPTISLPYMKDKSVIEHDCAINICAAAMCYIEESKDH